MTHSTHRTRRSPACCLIGIVSLLAVGCGSSGSDGGAQQAAAPSEFGLVSLSVSGGTGSMYPSFRAEILHYAVACGSGDRLSIVATASGTGTAVSINGGAAQTGSSRENIASLTPELDIPIDVSNAGRHERYTLHCVPTDLPNAQILHTSSGVSDGLIYLTPQFVDGGLRKTYLLIIDNNGVPRFTRRIDGNAVDFKRHPNGSYSYAHAIGSNSFGLSDHEIVILDEGFTELRRLTTVGLNHTDNHDVILLDDGGVVLLSYHSTIRDMTLYGLSSSEVVGDSVIQELDSSGNVLFEWNSWDHMDLADCQATSSPGFPSDYAHVNSVRVTPDGNFIASFRRCSQVLKIDRSTGEVIWQLGGSGSDFILVGDAFGEFCGQHTAAEVAPDRILLFDNGSFCLGDREDTFGQFSRAVEYRLDIPAGQAAFVRDYSIDNSYGEFSRSQGSIQLLSNGNWLIGWGSGPNVTATEIDSSGNKVHELRLSVGSAIAVSYRAFREE
jgi:hypothetical protein